MYEHQLFKSIPAGIGDITNLGLYELFILTDLFHLTTNVNNYTPSDTHFGEFHIMFLLLGGRVVKCKVKKHEI